RMMTRLSRTSTNPPCTAASWGWPRPSGSTTFTWAMVRAPRKGAWPVRKAISPPPSVRHTTMSASPDYRMRSGLTSWSGTAHGDLVLLRELVQAEDGDDVLELLVALEHLLDPLGHLVVVLAHHLGGQDVARRGQRVDGRVDAQRSDVAGQLGRGVQVGEG